MGDAMCPINDACSASGKLTLGWCDKHYQRWKRWGDPRGRQALPPAPDLPGEIWLPVVGWTRLYDVSNMGRVRSLPRTTVSGVSGGQILNATVSPNGYLIVNLCRGRAHMKTRLVHHLVLEAFVGLRPVGTETRHGAGGPTDNRLSNICWGTPKENYGDQVKDGTAIRGERVGGSRLTEGSVREMRRLWATRAYSQVYLGQQFGVSATNVWHIVNRRTWKHVA